MLKKILVTALLFVSPLLLAQNEPAKTEAKPHGYVGAEMCGMCHKTEKQGKQLSIWQESKHAQAYKTLLTDEANKIAKEKGFTTPAAKTPECLKCHVTAYGVDASLLGPKFNMEDGVQCESCHGAGADYKMLSIMKDKEKAIANGLQIHTDLKTFCATCHNSQSPTYKEGWDAEASFQKIKHDIPKGN